MLEFVAALHGRSSTHVTCCLSEKPKRMCRSLDRMVAFWQPTRLQLDPQAAALGLEITVAVRGWRDRSCANVMAHADHDA